MSNKYYVEVVAPDGLSHHIGPFERRSSAHEWIKQHSGGWNAVPAANAGISGNLTVIQPFRTEERSL